MDYIVLDLEWNQSPNGKGTENKAVPFEIVEIGAIKLNADFEIVSEFSEIIAPGFTGRCTASPRSSFIWIWSSCPTAARSRM